MNTISLVSQHNKLSVNNISKPQHNNSVERNSSAISFGSTKAERALKLLDGTIDTLISGSEFNFLNKMRFRSVLTEALPAIITPENFVNKGRESKVYRISDKYVAKIQRGHYADNSVHSYNTVSLPSKKFRDLDFYYGEPVARLGRVDILRNATPSKNHMYCGAVYHGSGALSSAELRDYETRFLPLCSSVPQESFDNLARNLKRLNTKTSRTILGKKETYVPDIINPNNLLISDGRFVLVDKLEKVPFENPNSVYTMLEPLVIRLNPEKEATRNPDLLDMRKNIFKKVLIASEKNDLPLDSPVKYEFSEWTLNSILGDDNIISSIEGMRKNGASLSERIDAINKQFS